jgi:YidC/Oxa1 family membrane protein insertase
MWDTIIISPFINVLLFIYNLIGQNFGIAIILFTILIRLITHPLMAQQMKGTQGMQDLQKNPKYLALQEKMKDEKYKDQKDQLAQEQMALYREMGISPFASCLPMLIQFPIIIGLYQAIIQAMANTPLDLLRLVRHIYPGFLDTAKLVPLNNMFLWMNLGQPERVYIFGVGIPLLAILVVITTYVQSKISTPPTQPGAKDQTAQMTNMMTLYMPIFMGWLAWTLASGLSLYFVVSNVIGILQYALLGKANWKSLLPSRKEPVVEAPRQGKSNRGKNESRKNRARSNRANS